MDFGLTISYDKNTDMVKIMLEPNEHQCSTNILTIPRDFYKPFISLLLATGQQMQRDNIDVGFEINSGDKYE